MVVFGCTAIGCKQREKMRTIRHILTLLLLLASIQIFCCDCKDLGPLDSLRTISYNHSDLVFLGELIEFDTTDFTYTFEIVELFKGEVKKKLIKGKYFDSCSKFPKEKCKWIVYAKIKDKNIIDISGCLASRSELSPTCVNCYTPPPPLSPNATEFEIEKSKELERILLEKAKNDWIEEVELLRNRATEIVN